MINIDWNNDYDLETTDPQDGGTPFCFWWEDMRPRETRDLVQEAYCRGTERFLKQNPTLIKALSLNDRVMWDDILEPFHHYTLTDLTGPSIEDAISLAFVNNSPPKIIILPWFLAVLLIDYEHTKWVKNPFDNFLSPYSAGNLYYQTWGYLGTYLGAELYASTVTEYIWITTESDPSKIDGNNTVFITLDRKIENY